MDPHRRYAAILVAALISTHSFASNGNQTDVIGWTKQVSYQFSAKHNIDDKDRIDDIYRIDHKWRSITPKDTQQGHDAAKSQLWIGPFGDPAAKFVTAQNLHLILDTCGELNAFSHQLSAQSLITQHSSLITHH